MIDDETGDVLCDRCGCDEECCCCDHVYPSAEDDEYRGADADDAEEPTV